MAGYYQYTIEDLALQDYISKQPGRIAYIDECGGYGFDFSKAGTSKFYVLTAVIIENNNLDRLHTEVERIKRNNGYGNTELKSSKVNESARARIMSQIMPLDFRLVVFVADKEKFHNDSPLVDFKKVFLKNMNGRLHQMLYKAYPRLKIQMDETGYPEFQRSFKEYVANHRTQLNLFNEYDFDFVNSRDEILVQLADFIGGSLTKHLLDPNTTNYFEMLKGKITAWQVFPEVESPFWGSGRPEDYKFDNTIYALAVKLAKDFISNNDNDDSDEKKAQVAVLRYLLFYAININPAQYVYSDELIRNIQQYVDRKVTKDFLFRRVIAPLRDNGVILASCVHGYKIPISVDDIITYLNQTTSTVGPMLNRMGICRKLILQGTDNELDVFNEEAFIRYKSYFDT